MTAPSPQLKKALAAIEYAENQGRAVVGVAVTKDGYELKFAERVDISTNAPNPIDLINMGEE